MDMFENEYVYIYVSVCLVLRIYVLGSRGEVLGLIHISNVFSHPRGMVNVSNCSVQLGTGYVGVYNGVEDCSIGTTGVKSTIRLID